MKNNTEENLLYSAIAGFSLFVIALGINRFSYNPIVPFLVTAHWATNSEAGYIGTANFLGYFLGAFIAQKLTRLMSHQKILACSLVVSVIASLLCVLNLGYIWLSFLRLIVGMIAGAIMVLSPSIILQNLDDAKKSFVSGVMFSGIGVGIASTSLLIPLFYRLGGAASIWLNLTFMTIFFALIAIKKCLGAQKVEKRLVDSKAFKMSEQQKKIYCFAFIGYLLYGIGLAPSLLFLADYVHLRLHASLQTSSDLFALFGIGCVCGSVMSGWMSNKFSNYIAIIISTLVGIISLISITFFHSIWAVTLSAFLSGFYLIALILCSSLLVAKLVGMEYHSKYWSQMTAGYAAIQFLAGYIFSYALSFNFSYHAMFFTASIVLIGSLMSYLFAKI